MTAFQLERPWPGVCRWSTHSPPHRVELTSHAVFVAGGWWIFDPIPLAPTLLSEGIGRDAIHGILLTNGNHHRASSRWQRQLECPIYVPCGREREVTGEVSITASEAALPGLELVPLEGGGPGERAGYVAALSLVVFGDAVIHLPDRALELLPDKYCSDPQRLRQRLQSLVDRPFDRAFFAHGVPLLRSARSRIKALL